MQLPGQRPEAVGFDAEFLIGTVASCPCHNNGWLETSQDGEYTRGGIKLQCLSNLLLAGLLVQSISQSLL